VADRFRLGQKDRRVARSPPIKQRLKLELSPGQKVRIESQGRATTAIILYSTATNERNHQAVDRHFAKATGTLAKTDWIDALMIARFGQSLQPLLLNVSNTTLHVKQFDILCIDTAIYA
jgi:hypothetical protein